MITFRPIGRLGNNMFQAAACIGYGKKYGLPWYIPLRRGGGPDYPFTIPQWWPNLPYANSYTGHRYEQHDPKDFNYKPIPRYDSVTLVGFFQSEKWFEGAHEEIKQAFPLTDYPEYRDYVSIHVRRGDYVLHANSFPPVGVPYLAKSISLINDTLNPGWKGLQKERQLKYLVFSDDIQWCKDNLTENSSSAQFFYSEGRSEFEDLSLMASCGYHIICNSSFSWWGAWLGKNPDRIVISPDCTEWYGPGFTGGPVIDLIPENWIKLKMK